MGLRSHEQLRENAMTDILPETASQPVESTVLNSIYSDLKRIATQQIRREPAGHLWSPQSLINEAYIRIVKAYGKDWVRNAHMVALWKRVMSNILIDHARAARSAKRSWGEAVPCSDQLCARTGDILVRLAVARAYAALDRANPRAAAAIRLTVIEGLTIQQAAPKLKLHVRTVKRALRAGKEILRRDLRFMSLAA